MAEWYYTQNNKQMGPVSWDELRQLATSGILQPTDLIWKEGMIDWLKANKKDGLYSTRGATVADDDDNITDRPRRRARQDDEDVEDDDRPRRRRRAAPQGMPLGAKVAIIGGSIAVGLLILVIIIVLLLGGRSTVQAGPGNYQVNLQARREDVKFFRFNAGQNVRITVTTQAVMNPDVDLFVERNNRAMVIADTRVSKDCFVTFVAPATDTYRVRVVNLGPGSASSNVSVQ